MINNLGCYTSTFFLALHESSLERGALLGSFTIYSKFYSNMIRKLAEYKLFKYQKQKQPEQKGKNTAQ